MVFTIKLIGLSGSNFPIIQFYEYRYRGIDIWVNYNDLTATSLGMIVSRGDYPQMTLFQVSELLQLTHIYIYL